MNGLNASKYIYLTRKLKNIDYIYQYNNDEVYVEKCRKDATKVEEKLLEMGYLSAMRLINKVVSNIKGYNFVELCPDIFPNLYNIERAIKKRKINYESEVDDCESECSCSDCASDFSESDCSDECESDCSCSDCEEEYGDDSEESESDESDSDESDEMASDGDSEESGDEMASDGDSDDTHYKGENKRIWKKEMNKQILLEDYHYDLERAGLLERRSDSKSVEKLKEVILGMEKKYKKLDDKRVRDTIKELKNKHC